MAERLRNLKVETIIFVLAILLALGVRFYNLGGAPLSDSEAKWALQALEVTQNNSSISDTTFGPQPAYIFLTGILFGIFGSSNFLARFWPALAGVLLVLLPFILSRPSSWGGLYDLSINRKAALILALALALDPGLVTVSRTAGGPMMALAFGLLAIGLLRLKNPLLAGISAGLALLSGPTIILGGLVILAAWVIYKYLVQSAWQRSSSEETESDLHQLPQKEQALKSKFLKPFLISAGTTVLVVGTMFLIFPQGIGAWFGSIPAFISGWFAPSVVPPSRLIAALIVYELFAVVFGVIIIVRSATAKEQLRGQEIALNFFLFMWILFGLLFLLLYPARQVSDLVWIIVPLWILAANELHRHIPTQPVHSIAIGQAVFIFVLAGLFWYTIAATTRTVYGTNETLTQYVILIGIFVLGGLTTALIALGWNWEISRRGLVIGVTAVLSVYSLSVMLGSSQIRQNQASELWSIPPSPAQTQLMTKVLNEISNWNTGFPQYIDIVSMVDTPSLRWALREFPEVQFLSRPIRGDLPAVVITQESDELPTLAEAYRGEDFVWWTNPGWSGALPPDLARWFSFREAPLQKEKIILWSRSDLYPGGEIDQEDFTDDY